MSEGRCDPGAAPHTTEGMGACAHLGGEWARLLPLPLEPPSTLRAVFLPHHPPALLYLIIGHYLVTPFMTVIKMSNKLDQFVKPGSDANHYAKIYKYPCGIVDILCSNRPIFREGGWEDANAWASPVCSQSPPETQAKKSQPLDETSRAESVQRSKRRAKSRVRRLALANSFTWFVTLTLDPEKVNRYDPAQVVAKLTNWAHNQVRRRGLRYILVPERHKDGALHFHGFFNDVLEAVPSGHCDGQGHMIYNLPGWTLGFTAAIAIYGDYPQAVAYVTKYIGKQGDKPAGRWYYSGGQLREPEVEYADFLPEELLDPDTFFADTLPDEFRQQFEKRAFLFHVPGSLIAVLNGLGHTLPREEVQDDGQLHITGGEYLGEGSGNT